MATPKVFISSTCYDLKYIRENLSYFIKTLGYEPILSEDGNVFYNPSLHTHDACITEIPNTQMFVLIIGGRFGGKFKGQESSITNAEYREAVKLKIPIFALVDSSVYNLHNLYLKNKENSEVDITKIEFPAVDSIKIFDFIDEVRSASVNNALISFRDFGDIENYLKKQWAAMMYDFLSSSNEVKRMQDTLLTLEQMNSRIEMLSKQILVSVGTEDAKIDALLYDEMLSSSAIRDLAFCGKRLTPIHVLVNASYRSCAKSVSINFEIDEEEKGSSIGVDGEISRPRFNKNSMDYKKLRKTLFEKLKINGLSVEAYLSKRSNEKIDVEVEDDDEA